MTTKVIAEELHTLAIENDVYIMPSGQINYGDLNICADLVISFVRTEEFKQSNDVLFNSQIKIVS